VFDRSQLTPWLLARARAAGHRLVHGVRLVAMRRRRAARVVGPAIERPSFVLAAGLVVALAAIKLLDPLMLARSSLFDGGAVGAVLEGLTSFGEGVELLVGSGVLLLAVAAIDPAGLGRGVRVRLVEVGAVFGFVFAAVAGSGLLASLIKNLFGRARPEHLIGDGVFEVHQVIFASKWAAFPSGHATTAGASAAALALIFPRWRGPILASGATIALTRVALGAHFPSDVAAGFALGWAFTVWLAGALAARRLVFRHGADGRLLPTVQGEPAGWFDLLADLLAARRPPQA
jgi:undecaprenyl-diphosphatase